MRLQPTCELALDHQKNKQEQEQEQAEEQDLAAQLVTLCGRLADQLDDATVYICTDNAAIVHNESSPAVCSSSRSTSSSTTSSSTSINNSNSNTEGFYSFDAKLGEIRSRSAVEWLSALTADLVMARRCPVVLSAKDLSLRGCSLMRFADVAVAPASSDDDDDNDDDSQGMWV